MDENVGIKLPRLRIAVTGSTGLLGSRLVTFLAAGGHRVAVLVRRRPRPSADEIAWDPAGGTIDAASLEGFDAVVHLAGANIASGRWTASRKREILDSRVRGTRLIAETLRARTRPPRVLLSASAIGYYGSRGDEILGDDAPSGDGFLAETCRAWEAAAAPAAEAGIRVVHPRIGIVLSTDGGALGKMIVPFRLGLGGPLGDGRQFMSWISMDDLIGAFHFAFLSDALRGPFNATAPNPVRNAEFTRALGAALHRPAIVPLPATAIRLGLGQLGVEVLLGSQRALPTRLQAAGFRFFHDTLPEALDALLER